MDGFKNIAGAASAAALCVLLAAPACAQSVADFYKGKTVNVLIGVGVGGEYDLHARLVSRYIGKHIPGNPTLVPQNMLGAGGAKMAAYLADVAPKDGTNIGMLANNFPAMQAAGVELIRFDLGKFQWIGSISPTVETMTVWKTAGVSTIEEARQKEVVAGASGKGAITYSFPAMLNDFLGTKFKIVVGYQGGNAINLAMERGEVHGVAGLTWAGTRSATPEWVRDKKIMIIAQYGLTPHPDLPDVPLVIDLATNERDRQALNLIFSRQEIGRPFAAPPALPAERLIALRRAFDATMKNKEFLADAERAKLDILPVDGETVADMVAGLAATPPDVVARVRKILAGQPEKK